MKNTFLMITGLLFALHSQMALSSVIPNQFHLLGKGIYSALFWDIYSAELFTPQKTWQKQQSYALRLTYFRAFSGEAIAKRSIEEIEGLGFVQPERLQQWMQQMQQIFPDVKQGDSLTGMREANGVTTFYYGQRLVGQVEDPLFADWFFGIWLHPNTSAPELRQQLLGIL